MDTSEELIIQHSLVRTYLEMARVVFDIPFDTPREENKKGHVSEIADLTLGTLSMTIIYSYLSVEAFANYYLYQLWEGRIGSVYQSKFRELIDDEIDDFIELRYHARFRELGDRLKLLCDVLGIERLSKSNPKLWQEFKELLENSRHFLVHPRPDEKSFAEKMKPLYETKPFHYTRIAESVLGYFYDFMTEPPPGWLKTNMTIRVAKVARDAASGSSNT
ncbi:hypothetical protein JYT16_00210 [Gemmatimonas aurantiaca]|nr:hypothetical protein [Gemmatimonas aurantiaca]